KKSQKCQRCFKSSSNATTNRNNKTSTTALPPTASNAAYSLCECQSSVAVVTGDGPRTTDSLQPESSHAYHGQPQLPHLRFVPCPTRRWHVRRFAGRKAPRTIRRRNPRRPFAVNCR